MKGKVVEVGCGTGRIYLELKKNTIDITGIDNFNSMLKILKNKAKTMNITPSVFQQDMANLKLDGKFDFIFLAYRTFMHLYDFESQIKTLRGLGEYITKGGEIIIDLFNPDLKRISLESSYQLLDKVALNNSYFYIWLWEEFDITKQIVRNTFKVEKTDIKGKIIDTTLKEFSARWFYPIEFENLVKTADLRVKNVYADYNEKPFTGIEDKMIWVLAKK